MTEIVMRDAILSFDGEYRFLSNFYPSLLKSGNPPIRGVPVYWDTVEHAYQASKTDDQDWRERIHRAPSPGQAKKIGRLVPLRDGWEDQKYAYMNGFVWAKFACNEELKQLLIATEDRFLVEGNTWGDTYWGVCNGRGINMLGHILMQVRSSLAR